MQAVEHKAGESLSKRLMTVIVLAAMVLSSFVAVDIGAETPLPSEGTPPVDPNVPERPGLVTTMADDEGWFAPAAKPHGEAKILIIDDDANTFTSSDFGEVLITSALNEYGYKYDIFRSGYWNGTYYDLPWGPEGLDLLDNYEVVIWWHAFAEVSMWRYYKYDQVNRRYIYEGSEVQNVAFYLDGKSAGDVDEYDDYDGFSVDYDKRNLIVMTEHINYAYGYYYDEDGNGQYITNTHLQMYYTGPTFDGLANPMDGVRDSVMDGKSFSTDWMKKWYPSLPRGIKPCKSDRYYWRCDQTPDSEGALWQDPAASDYQYHAIQLEIDERGANNQGNGYDENGGQRNFKTFTMNTLITNFDKASDRGDYFNTLLDWMEVEPDDSHQVDIGISNIDIPMHSRAWRKIQAGMPVEVKVDVTNFGRQQVKNVGIYLKVKNEFGQRMFENTFWSDTPFKFTGAAGNIDPGDTWQATFNVSNDADQLGWSGGDREEARYVALTTSGRGTFMIKTLYYGGETSGISRDTNKANDEVVASVTAAKWVDGAEPDDPGTSMTYVDTDHNLGTVDYYHDGGSLDHYNVHKVSTNKDNENLPYVTYGFDWDADGDWEGGPREGQGTANHTGRYNVYMGEYAYAYFNPNGWVQDGEWYGNVSRYYEYSWGGGYAYVYDYDRLYGRKEAWDYNELVGCYATIISGPGAGQTERIDYNYRYYFRVRPAYDENPTSSSKYHIECNGVYFIPEQNQDDAIVSPVLDLTGMSDAVLQMLFMGNSQYPEYWHIQIKKETETEWTSLYQRTFFLYSYNFGGWYYPYNYYSQSPKYIGLALSDEWYGQDDSYVKFRFLWDGDSRNTTMNYYGYMMGGPFIDEIALVGTERITKDLAVTDVSARADGFIKYEYPSSGELDREINATVTNAGSSPWKELPVDVKITNLQREVVDTTTLTIPGVFDGYDIYGDLDEIGSSDERELFYLFSPEEPNTYFVEFKARVIADEDQFPWNNSKRITLRVYDRFFYDDGENPNELDLTENFLHWNSKVSSKWFLGDPTDWSRAPGWDENGEGKIRSYVFMHNTANGVNRDYVPEADYGIVTPAMFDRDGSGVNYEEAEAIDLRAAYYPQLEFFYQSDLGDGDVFRVQISTTYVKGEQEHESDWETIASFTGRQSDWGDEDGWRQAVVNLTEWTGNRVYLQFRVTADNDGDVGQGVVVDEVAVIGSEYRRNVDIVDVDVEQFTSAGENHGLSFEVKNIGTESQTGVYVAAHILKTEGNTATIAWPTNGQPVDDVIGVELSKGESYTVTGQNWVWGEDLEPGLYTLVVETHLAGDMADEKDENPSGNVRQIQLVLGAPLLRGDQWEGKISEGWDITGKSEGIYLWSEKNRGDLESETFTVWNQRPVLLVDVAYELGDAEIVAEVAAQAAGSNTWSQFYPVLLRERVDDTDIHFYSFADLTLYDGISQPTSWTGSSNVNGQTRHTFWADLGLVTGLADNFDKLDEKYVGGKMKLRLSASAARAGDGDGSSTFNNPSVFGMEQFGLDMRSITPPLQTAEPSPRAGDKNFVSYTIQTRNVGAASDFIVVDVEVYLPGPDGVPNGTKLFQMDGDTVLELYTLGSWGVDDQGFDRGDSYAWVFSDGRVVYPGQDGELDTGDDVEGLTEPRGWDIWNPTHNRPSQSIASELTKPGEVESTAVTIYMGYADSYGGTMPGDYLVEVTAHNYNNPDVVSETARATLKVDKPDLAIGEVFATKQVLLGLETSKTVTFSMELTNEGTETSEEFTLGLIEVSGTSFASVGPSLHLRWDSAVGKWLVRDPSSGLYVAETGDGSVVVEKRGGSTWLTFIAQSQELGVVVDSDSTFTAHGFYMKVDRGEDIIESDEDNNLRYVEITAVGETVTTPSFSMTAGLMSLSALVAALGVAFSRRREEEDEEEPAE